MNKLIMVCVGLMMAAGSAFAESSEGLSVSFDGARYFTQAQTDKLMEAKKIIETVINSEEFKTAVLNFSYDGQVGFVQNNGLSNQEIYDYLMTGAEKYPFQTSPDQIMNFDIELFTSSWFGRGTLGYTDIHTKTIHINTRFYNGAEPNEIAMNLVHEWTHKMGFDHDSNHTARRDYSVPYGIGYLVRDLGAKLNPTSLRVH